jgi:hypothetical protein
VAQRSTGREGVAAAERSFAVGCGEKKQLGFLSFHYNKLYLNNTMNFSAESDAKLTLNIKTGNVFSNNTTNFGGRGPSAKGLFQIGQPIPAQFQQGRKF